MPVDMRLLTQIYILTLPLKIKLPSIASPVEGSALSGVSSIDIYTSLPKVHHSSWLVSLGSHMEHIDVMFINGLKVSSTLLNQVLYEHQIPMEGGKVQSCEAFFTHCLLVYPSLHSSVSCLLILKSLTLSELSTS